MTHHNYPGEDHDGREQEPQGGLEEFLREHLDNLDDEHALLSRMWDTSYPTAHPGPSAAHPEPAHPDDVEHQPHPDHLTVLHQARALTAGDLRAALLGIPDAQPIAIDVPLDPGGLLLHRHVLSAIGGARLLLADDDEVLDPSFVLRTDFPSGLYEIPKDPA